MRKMCKALSLAENAYYQWLRRERSREQKYETERELVDQIRNVFNENYQVYGYRRMYRAIKAKQTEMRETGKMLPESITKPISEYKVRRLMQQNGMYPVSSKKFKPYGKGKGNGQFYEDKLKQEFNPRNFNEVWVGDITYIKTILGWVYLSVVIDLYNREIIGYSISKYQDVELVKRALCNALTRTGGGGERTIFHSDRGIQYSSKTFQKMLEEHQLIGSMSKPKCPYDNACAESFFSTAKRECIYRKEYVTLEEVKRDLFEYIELFYNRKRMHGSLGYMSPVGYRQAKAA